MPPAAPMPEEYRNQTMQPKGVANRNGGLAWVRAQATEGVVFFADDDNAYDLRLFEEVQLFLFFYCNWLFFLLSSSSSSSFLIGFSYPVNTSALRCGTRLVSPLYEFVFLFFLLSITLVLRCGILLASQCGRWG